jgi:hypothetical protein
VQGHGPIGQFDSNKPQASRLDRRRRGRCTADLLEAEQPSSAESGLSRGRMVWIGGVSAQPDVLHPERGGRANDRPDVERLAHRVKEQEDPCLRGLAPGPVQPLDLGLTELTRH